MSRNLKTSLILSILLIGLVRLQPIWERNPGGFWNVLFYLSIAILFIWLITKVVKEIVHLVKNRKGLTFKLFIPLIIMTITILDVSFNPFKIDLEKKYGKVIFIAYYEGTQNQATLKLRDNGNFDVHSTGVFFSDYFFTGNYSRNEDTIFMNFDSKTPRLLGDTLIIKGENLYRKKLDTVLTTHYYLGNYKGLN